MKQVMNMTILTVAVMILASCSKAPEKASSSPTPTQGAASPTGQAETKAQKSNVAPQPVPTNSESVGPTIDLVMQNVDAYKGKRVRWFGQAMSLEPKGKIVRAVYINDPRMMAAAKDAPTFVAEIKPDKKMDFFHLSAAEKTFQEFSRGWITGTIQGTETINVSVTSPTGEESTSPKKVPVLKNASFEKDDSKR